MSDDIARRIAFTVRKVEVLKRTEAKLAEAMRRQDEKRAEARKRDRQ